MKRKYLRGLYLIAKSLFKYYIAYLYNKYVADKDEKQTYTKVYSEIKDKNVNI